MYDTTCSTWLLRHLLRSLLMLALPVLGVLFLLPADLDSPNGTRGAGEKASTATTSQ